ncbi:hypothetical protein C8J56DRAFT_1045942 [Mycena floridula]|nr:hypothetical protein C8J56DRAFT_1045942 [Mycena floridula]
MSFATNPPPQEKFVTGPLPPPPINFWTITQEEGTYMALISDLELANRSLLRENQDLATTVRHQNSAKELLWKNLQYLQRNNHELQRKVAIENDDHSPVPVPDYEPDLLPYEDVDRLSKLAQEGDPIAMHIGKRCATKAHSASQCTAIQEEFLKRWTPNVGGVIRAGLWDSPELAVKALKNLLMKNKDHKNLPKGVLEGGTINEHLVIARQLLKRLDPSFKGRLNFHHFLSDAVAIFAEPGHYATLVFDSAWPVYPIELYDNREEYLKQTPEIHLLWILYMKLLETGSDHCPSLFAMILARCGLDPSFPLVKTLEKWAKLWMKDDEERNSGISVSSRHPAPSNFEEIQTGGSSSNYSRSSDVDTWNSGLALQIFASVGISRHHFHHFQSYFSQIGGYAEMLEQYKCSIASIQRYRQQPDTGSRIYQQVHAYWRLYLRLVHDNSKDLLWPILTLILSICGVTLEDASNLEAWSAECRHKDATMIMTSKRTVQFSESPGGSLGFRNSEGQNRGDKLLTNSLQTWQTVFGRLKRSDRHGVPTNAKDWRSSTTRVTRDP